MQTSQPAHRQISEMMHLYKRGLPLGLGPNIGVIPYDKLRLVSDIIAEIGKTALMAYWQNRTLKLI